MRAISLVDRLEFEFTGSVLRKGLTLGDVDNDGHNELIVGGESGEVWIFKEAEKWQSLAGLHAVSCVAVGDILNDGKNFLVVVTGDGWCHIFISCVEMISESVEEEATEGVEQVDGGVFSNESTESEKSTSSESPANTTGEKERVVFKRVHKQRIPPNTKDILLADIDGDGKVELVLGLTDRVVRSYRWQFLTPEELDKLEKEKEGLKQLADLNDSQEVFDGYPPGRLVGLHKWECAKQIGSVSLHNTRDGAPSLLVAQPGGTFMRIICQSEDVVAKNLASQPDSASSHSESLVGSKIDYQFLGISRMRNQNISTEIVGNLKKEETELTGSSSSHSSQTDADAPKKPKGSPYAVATLDGTIMLVQDEVILWAIAVDHQIFALTKLDVTGNGDDDIVACAWDGQTYILDQEKHSVRFHLEEPVQAFECGYYSLGPDFPAVTCFVYITFRNKIYIYYDIPLKVMICKRFEPDLSKIKDVLDDEYKDDGKLNRKARKQLVEYLLYGVEM